MSPSTPDNATCRSPGLIGYSCRVTNICAYRQMTNALSDERNLNDEIAEANSIIARLKSGDPGCLNANEILSQAEEKLANLIMLRGTSK